MRPHTFQTFPRRLAVLTRRFFLQAIGLAFASSFRPIAAGFTAVADELARLMRWCACGPDPRFAAG